MRESGQNGGMVRLPWVRIVSAVGFLLLAVIFFLPRVEVMAVLNWLEVAGPWVFYLAFALLTLGGVPSTPFFLAGGVAFPLWQNLVGATLGMMVHFALAYLISARWLRATIRRMLVRRGLTPPGVVPGQEWRVAVMIKFAPGVPMFLKSYLMGVAGIPWRVFIGVSMPATMVYALAFLTLGEAVREGSIGSFLGGITLLVFATAAWKFMKARSRS